MVADVSYEAAAGAFKDAGLAQRRKSRPAFSSNFVELQTALSIAGVQSRMRRFRSWDDIAQKAIVKVCTQKSGNWHWVVAKRENAAILILDPATDLPSSRLVLPDTVAIHFDIYAPQGCFIDPITT